jgi:hypothetical protein
MEIEFLVKAKLKTVDVRIDSVICADPNQIPFSAFIHTAKVLNAAAKRSFVSALLAQGATPRSRDFGGEGRRTAAQGPRPGGGGCAADIEKASGRRRSVSLARRSQAMAVS